MRAKTNSVESYRHNLLVLYPSLAMGAVGLICILGYLQTRVASLHPDLAAFEARTAEISGNLDTLFADAVSDLEVRAPNAVGQGGLVRDSNLADLAESSAFFDRLALYDTFGVQVAGAKDCLPSPEQSPGLMEDALAGMPVISAPSFGTAPGAPEQVYALVPVLDAVGQPRYVLIGELAMDRVWDVLEAGSDYEDVVVALLADAGRVLLPSGAELSQEIGGVIPADAGVTAGRAGTDDQQQYFYVAREARRSEVAGGPAWTVLMLKPYESVTGLIRRNSLYNSLTALITLGLVSLVGIRMNRRVYSPLANAVQAAGKVAKGQLNVSVAEEGPQEVRKIAEAINHMMAEVRYHRHTLSSMVKTRTESLEAARKALEHNMHHLKASYDSAQDAVLIIDVLNGEILQANRQLAQLFEFGDVDLGSLTGDDFCAAMREMFSEAVDFQNRWEYYTEHPDAEGTEEWTLLKPRRMVLSVYTSPVRSGDERTIMGRLWTFKDITEEREMDEKLRQSQKMDAMSHLAGSLAHDFNNLLTVILGNLSIARMEIGESEDTQSFLEAAEGATNQATDLVKQLFGFSDRARPHLQVVNLNEIVGKVTDVLRQTADPRVTVLSELSSDLWDVPADSSQIEQVIMNLSMNALDAMPAGGTLILRSENVTLRPGDFDLPPSASAGQYTRIIVKDTGIGMPTHIRERVFEPFFTTKAAKGGQGLGLAMAYGAISKHGGWITCDSTPDEGTEFSVYLQKAIQRSKPMMVEQASKGAVGQIPMVLVVDDEAGVRRIAISVLKRGGFATIEACDGEEAITVFQDRRAEVSAVLLDLSMPKLSGRETFIALKQMAPELPILLCSGYPVDGDEFAGETGFHPDGVIQKPFNVMDLCDTVNSVLNHAEIGVA